MTNKTGSNRSVDEAVAESREAISALLKSYRFKSGALHALASLVLGRDANKPRSAEDEQKLIDKRRIFAWDCCKTLCLAQIGTNVLFPLFSGSQTATLTFAGVTTSLVCSLSVAGMIWYSEFTR